jgi:predicted DNA-binding transcriptional regulator AlpA
MIEADSYVYCIAEEGTGLVKIGVTQHLKQRIGQLQTGSPRKLHLVAAFPGSFAEEAALRYAWGHLHQHGEWHRDEGGQISSWFRAREEAIDRLEETGSAPDVAFGIPTNGRTSGVRVYRKPVTVETKVAPVYALSKPVARPSFVGMHQITAALNCSSNAIRAMIRRGAFPKPRVFGNKEYWIESEIDSIIEKMAA